MCRICDLKLFQDVLGQNFKNYEGLDKMRPDANQPAKLFATSKSQKFNNIEDIKDTQYFPEMLHDLPPLINDEG